MQKVCATTAIIYLEERKWHLRVNIQKKWRMQRIYAKIVISMFITKSNAKEENLKRIKTIRSENNI